MLLKVILKKSYDLMGSTWGFLGLIFVLLFYSITAIIRIFWSPIEYGMWGMAIIILCILVYRRMPNNLSSRVSRIENQVSNQKYEKSLKELDKILSKKVPKLKGNKKNKIYYKCIFSKALCLLNLGLSHGDLEKLKESITLFEENIKIAFRKNISKNVPILMLHLGLCHYYLGYWENNEESLEEAIDIFKNALEEKNIEDDNFNISIYSRIGYTYEILSSIYSKKEHLQKSLESLDYAYELSCKINSLEDQAYINNRRGSILRKLYEINNDKATKDKAIEMLNNSIFYCSNNINKHTKRFFMDYYVSVKFHIGKAYFDLFILDKLEDDLKKSREALTEASTYYTKEKSYYYNKQINEMLDYLDKSPIII
ncbi:MAG: hypothetical protein N4A57_12955 [Anaeromicrobium sp.]|jgi:tetratricopeptide (TPR) repeat protein|uniref:hypothetical protein n=1 Tax=Anaeromicrobium sp. TaxID=1929132 RepID=UPI0025F9E4F9|nr:hypothetical protein [Anaeromicrobium sp.]MCT4595159.1 hypothetical protein [Anaeromicrobium sp.]